MQQLQQSLQQGRSTCTASQSPVVLQQLTPRSLHPTSHRKAGRGARHITSVASPPRQILVSAPQLQQSSPTASLSYTSFEDDSLQSIIQLQEVSLEQELSRLEQLVQDMTNNCSSLADKVSPGEVLGDSLCALGRRAVHLAAAHTPLPQARCFRSALEHNSIFASCDEAVWGPVSLEVLLNAAAHNAHLLRLRTSRSSPAGLPAPPSAVAEIIAATEAAVQPPQRALTPQPGSMQAGHTHKAPHQAVRTSQIPCIVYCSALFVSCGRVTHHTSRHCPASTYQQPSALGRALMGPTEASAEWLCLCLTSCTQSICLQHETSVVTAAAAAAGVFPAVSPVGAAAAGPHKVRFTPGHTTITQWSHK